MVVTELVYLYPLLRNCVSLCDEVAKNRRTKNKELHCRDNYSVISYIHSKSTTYNQRQCSRYRQR